LKLNYITLAIVVVFMALFARHAFGTEMTPLQIAGLCIAILAFLLLALARIQLGGAFSVQAKASTLVTTGLYSRIRNPIYFFGALMIAGIIIYANRPWFLLFYVVLIPLQIVRSRAEERLLAEKFGEAYAEYKRKTWF
jgi:protein-S-isoprenylcysteine O-methyltransferase Ste14